MKPKTILLDKATIGNDIDLKEITKQCNLISYDYTKKEKTSERIKDAEIIITNKVVISTKEFEAASKLKLICVAATGYNNINIQEAKKRNIIVANVKGYSSESVAQTVFGYILTIMNSIPEVAKDIKVGLWQKSQTFTMLNHPFLELSGKNLGIIGYGTIGKRVAQIAEVFGMNILICKSLKRENLKTPPKQENILRVTFNDILRKSDIISIHTPLTAETENLISEKELLTMKKSSILINTARGGIVNENDLYNALNNNDINFAAMDVLTTEPPTNGNILFNAPNIIITPHTAWTSFESRKRLVSGIAENISFFKKGRKDFDLCK
jgi:glycerate dehydrogenase